MKRDEEARRLADVTSRNNMEGTSCVVGIQKRAMGGKSGGLTNGGTPQIIPPIDDILGETSTSQDPPTERKHRGDL